MYFITLLMPDIIDLPSRIFCSIGPADVPHSSHRYLSKYFVDSVFPAPDSPDTIIDCDCFRTFISRNALSAARKETLLMVFTNSIKYLYISFLYFLSLLPLNYDDQTWPIRVQNHSHDKQKNRSNFHCKNGQKKLVDDDMVYKLIQILTINRYILSSHRQ